MLTYTTISYKRQTNLPAKQIGLKFGISAEDTARLHAHGTRLAYLALCST
jgi:hypothetical protein